MWCYKQNYTFFKFFTKQLSFLTFGMIVWMIVRCMCISHQANRFACGWMSKAVSPFTVCKMLIDSGIRGSKKRTSPFTLKDRGPKMWTHYKKRISYIMKWFKLCETEKQLPDTDNMSFGLLLQVCLHYPSTMFPIRHHTAGKKKEIL